MGVGAKAKKLKWGHWLYTKGKQMITIDFQFLLTFEIDCSSILFTFSAILPEWHAPTRLKMSHSALKRQQIFRLPTHEREREPKNKWAILFLTV